MSGNLFIDNKIKQIPITEAELMKTRFTWIYFLGFSCQSCDCFMIHLKKWKEIHKNRDTAWHCVLFCQLCLDSAEAIWMEVVLFCVPAWQSWAPQTLSLDLQLGIKASQVAQIVKLFACNVGDLGLIPELGRSPGEGNGYSLQYSCLENPMDRGAWQATVHGVTKSQTRLNN